jgi:AcrR family transcriptional regulator
VPAPSNRERVLAAAGGHVRDHGPGALTLEAAAAAAGVSKGGLLYHFPTKHALITALIDGALDGFEAAVDDLAAVTDGPVPWTRAYVEATFDLEVSRPDVAAALLSAEIEGSPVLGRCAARFASWDRRIAAEGLSPGTAALVRFAADGWWTYAALDGSPDDATKEALRRRLHEVIDAEVQP